MAEGGGSKRLERAHLQITGGTLLADGAAQREIERRTGVDRKTIRLYKASS